MELHQIRYFLALTKTLNFTRAAQECNVSQPALSRAISQLEGELGSDLFRRERSLTHLTEFGQKVLPELRQCYEASLRAKTVAASFLKAGHAPLNIALSRSIEMDALSPLLAELTRAFPRIEIRLSRSSPHEIGVKLKNGDVEIGISGPLGDDWDRLDTRRLFVEKFGLLMSRDHRLGLRNGVDLIDLRNERLLSWPDCAMSQKLVDGLRELGTQSTIQLEVASRDDLPSLVQAQFGVGIWPLTRSLNGNLLINEVRDLDLSRWIHVHTVVGRRLSPGAVAFIGLLRTRDWSAAMTSENVPAETRQ